MNEVSLPELQLKHADRMFIGGDWYGPDHSQTFDVINPTTEDVVMRVALAQEVDVARAVAAAREAFDNGPWPRMSSAERAPYLRAIADQLDRRSAELARSWTDQVGILHSFAQFMTPFANNFFRYYGDLSDRFDFIERRPSMNPGYSAYLVREPVGVVAAIVPWNAPLLSVATKVAPALMAGCAVVLKASPETPLEAWLLAEACEEAGLPPGVLNIISADRDVSELLVRHPGVDKVSFTGSTAAGKKIGVICAERVARCTLELGGKSPALVMDDYDVEAFAKKMAGYVCFAANQNCASISRVIVTRDRQSALLEALRESFGAIRIGDPYAEASQIGPITLARQRDRIEQYIALGLEEGGRIVVGGGRPEALDRGFFLQPTVFADVDNSTRIAREEIFGPVITVLAAEDEQDIIRIADDSPYGLGCTVFTGDPDKAWRAARVLRSGTVSHNELQFDFNVGFGGFKQSGIGREGGPDGILPYLESKTVILTDAPSALT